MKEYEIVAKFCNACAGSSRPETFFEEAELESTDTLLERCKCGAKSGSPEGEPLLHILGKY